MKEHVPLALEILRVYGIWSFEETKLVFISMTVDEADFKFDIEDYDEKKYSIVQFDVVVDLNSLAP